MRLLRRSVLAALAAGLLLQLAAACFSPADLYAVEVVLNKPGVKYDLSKLSGVKEIEHANGVGYAYRSRFDPRLVVVLSEQRLLDGDQYLAVRIQVPVEWREYTVYACSIPIPCRPKLTGNISLILSPGHGEVEVTLGTLTFDSNCLLRFKPVLSATVGKNESLIVSGSLYLRSIDGGLEYRISMPCLLSLGEGCARILAIIPGYDAPMLIKPGTYEVILTLSWFASARTVLVVERLNVECHCKPWAPLPRELGWELEEGVLEKRVGDATIRVSSGDCSCEVVVEGPADPSEVTGELEKLFEALNLGKELVRRCDLAKSSDVRLTPSERVSEDEVRAALKAELEWLVESGVIAGLEPGDITLITAAAKLGYAGWNQRLVWYEGDWIPYSNMPGAMLVRCVTGVRPEYVARSEEYNSLSQASAKRETPLNYLNIAIAVIAAVAAATISYVLLKRKLCS